MSKELDQALEILSLDPLPVDAEQRINDLMDEAPEGETFEFEMILEGLSLAVLDASDEETQQGEKGEKGDKGD